MTARTNPEDFNSDLPPGRGRGVASAPWLKCRVPRRLRTV